MKYRHVAGGLGAAGEWFSTWVMVFGGGTGINAVGPKIFIWPLICCFLAAAYVYFCCPETTGRTLEELDALFAKGEARNRIEAHTGERRHSHISASHLAVGEIKLVLGLWRAMVVMRRHE